MKLPIATQRPSNGSGKVYGILGSNIDYSLSPLIYNTLFTREKIPASYKLFDLQQSDLSKFIEAVRILGIDGFNVTTPFKNEIICHLNKLDKLAAVTGSVNLVINRNNRLLGYNTDYLGIKESLEQKLKIDVKGKTVSLIGSGGAARTVYYYLVRRYAKRIKVYHHSKAGMIQFTAFTNSLTRNNRCEHILFQRSITEFSKSDLCINCTPQPLAKLISRQNLQSVVKVFELRYGKERTFNRQHINGNFMLAVQAAANFQFMTGKTVNVNRILRIVNQ